MSDALFPAFPPPSSRDALDMLTAGLESRSPTAPSWWEAARSRSVGWMQDVRLPKNVRLAWSEAALAAVKGKEEVAKFDPLRILAERARICVYLIDAFGPENGDCRRDPDGVVQMMRSRLGDVSPEIRVAADSWRHLEPHEVLHLRLIGNAVKSISSILGLIRDEELREWAVSWDGAIRNFP